MAAANFADAIQNALVATAVARPFPRISYAVQGTGGAQSTATMTTVLPKTVLAFQAGSDFDISPRQRRDSRRRERVNWTWFLTLQFDSPVSLVEFEDDIMATAPRVVRDPSIGVDQQVDLLLENAEYENPVTQQPSRGTKVTYRFTAQLTPY
jgi:hypothetical protein